MKKNLRIILALALACALFVLGFALGGVYAAPLDGFPAWEAAPATEAGEKTLSVSPVSLTTGVRMANMRWDELAIAVENTGTETVRFGSDAMRVDYKRFGRWYTVFSKEIRLNAAAQPGETGEDFILYLPSGLLCHNGRYRVWLSGVGYVGGKNGFALSGVPTAEYPWEEELSSLYGSWEEVTEEDAVNDHVTLESGSVAYVHNSETGVTQYELMIRGKNAGEKEVVLSAGYRVDRLMDGTWYTVYDPVRNGSAVRIPPGEGAYSRYTMPEIIGQLPGVYRLYINNIGYCRFETSDEDPPTYNSFPTWMLSSGEREIDPNAELKFISLVSHPMGTVLTMNLTNTSKTENLVYGDDIRVDYLADGEWYTVYYPRAITAAARFQYPDTTEEVKAYLSEDIFSQPGAYRYFLSHIAYCEFVIE